MHKIPQVRTDKTEETKMKSSVYNNDAVSSGRTGCESGNILGAPWAQARID